MCVLTGYEVSNGIACVHPFLAASIYSPDEDLHWVDRCQLDAEMAAMGGSYQRTDYR